MYKVERYRITTYILRYSNDMYLPFVSLNRTGQSASFNAKVTDIEYIEVVVNAFKLAGSLYPLVFALTCS